MGSKPKLSQPMRITYAVHDFPIHDNWTRAGKANRHMNSSATIARRMVSNSAFCPRRGWCPYHF